MPLSSGRRVNPSLLVASIPAIALVGGLPFVNRLEPTVFGLPFLLAWILGWVLVTPVFLYVAYRASTATAAAASTGRDARAASDDRRGGDAR
jgi:hypothetical protein